MLTVRRLSILLTPVLVAAFVFPAQAVFAQVAKKSALKPATAPASPKQFQIQATKIPAGSQGNFIVLFAAQGPTAALPIEESKQVSIPVAGRVGGVDLPQGTTLVGRLNRINETSGTFTFTTMLVNNQVFNVNAASTPIPGKLRVDPYSLQTPKDAKDMAAASVAERRGVQQGRATRQYGAAGGALAGMATGSWMAGLAAGALGSIIGTSQQTDAVNQSTAKQEEVLNRDIPSIMVAELSPYQNLSVYFNEDVDLGTPIATLPAAVQPQGIPILPNAAPTPAAAYPASIVGPQPSYPGSYGYPYPVPTQAPVYPGVVSQPIYPGVSP